MREVRCMPMYDVTVVGKGKQGKDVRGTASGESWFEAMSAVLAQNDIKVAEFGNIMCEVKADGVVVRGGDGQVAVNMITIDEAKAAPKMKAAPPSTMPTTAASAQSPESRLSDIVADLMVKTSEIQLCDDVNEVANRLLDLAMQVIPSESGGVFLSDINGDALHFVATRGPKADEVKGLRVKMGQGVVGFCAQNGVALGVGDTAHDPLFCKEISTSVGYSTRSLLCAPVQHGGRVYGAIELVNHKGDDHYAPHDIDLLNFLAHEFVEYLVHRNP